MNRRAFVASLFAPLILRLLQKPTEPGRRGVIIHGDGALFRSRYDRETFDQLFRLQGGFNCRHAWIAKPMTGDVYTLRRPIARHP